jgi:hypothetical protein
MPVPDKSSLDRKRLGSNFSPSTTTTLAEAFPIKVSDHSRTGLVGQIQGRLSGLITVRGRSIPGLAVVIVSLGGCRRTKPQIVAGDSGDPMGGIERSEGSDESAAAIGCNHRHDVHVVVKKV